MYNGKRILVVVPARGGSKGVPKKNIRDLNGKPLIHWTGEFIQELGDIDLAIVSTDCDDIARVASESGLFSFFRRPEKLSGDRVGDLEVLQHALVSAEEHQKVTFDVIVMLQPTSPLREKSDVVKTYQKLIENNYSSVWTVSEVDLKYHPLKQLSLNEKGCLDFFHIDGKEIIARQQLKRTFYRNGASYAISRSCLMEDNSIIGDNASYVLSKKEMVSIDTLEDFKKVETLMKA